MRAGLDCWRWSNVPIPEAHVAGLIVGVALQAVVPIDVPVTLQPHWIVGWTLIGAGILIGAWAVRAAGLGDLERPSVLVTTGPFTFSRNPMYVAWTALYVGIALLVNTVWLVGLLPLVMVATHRTVLQEERLLEGRFGDDYRDYTHAVRRYL